MLRLSADEFKARYGEQSVSPTPIKAPSYFNFQAAKEVFTRAGNDLSLANEQTVANPTLANLGRSFGTASLQGGLAPVRALGAGLFGTETGQKVTGGVIEQMTKLGEAITPDSVLERIGKVATDTIEGYSAMDPQEQLNQRNKLAVAELLSYYTGGSATKDTLVNPVVQGSKVVVETAKDSLGKTKLPDAVVKEASTLREDVRAIVGEKSVDPQLKASAQRGVEQPLSLNTPQQNGLKGAASRTEDVLTKYDRYLKQSEQAIDDIKVDPAIAEVGEKMGDAFNSVVAQRKAVGAVIGDELKEWGKLRVSVSESVDKLLAELKDSGLSYNPKTRDLTSFQGTRFVPEEIEMLNGFVGRLKLLGESPTVSQIDNFIARARSEMQFTKGRTGVLGTTNAERIINGGIAGLKDSLNPSKNGIQQLSKYWKVNQVYSDLSDFVEEGAQFLGKKTQSGDFAKDASVAKSAVQSILNSGKKDWMVRLEALTGYNALDDAVLALQAMKDAGDFRGLSLLQAMKESGLPTSKAGFTGMIIDKAVDAGKRVVAGKPSDQTRAFLRSLKKGADLKVADKKIVAKQGIPKTKEIAEIESKIAKNVESQKAAIKANDFALVAKLKDLYQELVRALKDAIKTYREMSPKDRQGGFIKIPFGDKKAVNVQALNTEWKNLLKKRDSLLRGGASPNSNAVKQVEKALQEIERERHK